MEIVLRVLQVFLAVGLIGVVLLQRSEGGGLGIGSTGGFMSSRGTANALTRTTAILAGSFFVTSLLLSILAGWGRAPTSIIQGGSPAPVTAPGAPAAPLGSGGGVLNQLQGAPAAPSGPQVPQSK